MPLQSTSGAASYDAFGGGVAAVPKYIEDYFSTFLYTGNGSTQTITNGIDLSTKGGLVWGKNRSTDATFGQNYLSDTSRGITRYLVSNNTDQQFNPGNVLTSANTTGFSIGDSARLNNNGVTYVSWSFAKAPKFFDIVTWSGDSIYPRTITHNLGSTPGCIITKNTTESSNWFTYHRSLGNFQALRLNTTAAPFVSSNNMWNATSTSFTLTADLGMNESGSTYIAYLFAHDAGGFGLTGTDNVISCGSYVGDGSGDATVNLGWEPQFLLTKLAETFSEDWRIFDTMRGWDNSTSQGSAKQLVPNSSAAETTRGGWKPTATGFQVTSQSSGLKVIYIAIRRGPMKVPTDATKVFKPMAYSGNDVDNNQTTNFPVDLGFVTSRDATTGFFAVDRLRGPNKWPLDTWQTAAEPTLNGYIGFDSNTQFKIINNGIGRLNSSARTYVLEAFQRAPSFFDEVCYTGTGSATTFSHNLQAVPEMMLIKRRDTTAQWQFYFAGLGNTKSVQLPDNDKVTSSGLFNNTSPTSSVFTVGVNSPVNASGGTYVAYLAATCAGVSKVGTYTGTGTTQQIDCGFAAGARFVLIKNVGVNDYAYGYYVWDTARGIVSGNDPYLLLNSNAAEVTNTDYIDTYSAGFEISSTAPVGINANGDQFVYWAIA